MRFLSRPEELILMTIWKLGEGAYCVPIRETVSTLSGQDWSFGAVYVPLARLEKKGLIRSRLGAPTKVRGGRGKRFYTVTKNGLKSLAEIRELHDTMWQGMPALAPAKIPS